MLLVILRILVTIVAISLLIVVHEFGHFICAKAVGMRVEVFSIGFWKRLFGVKIGDTDYRVSLVPLGGFVKVSGESPEEGKGKPYEFWSKSPGQRALFVVGGVGMNAVMAVVLFIVAFAVGVPFSVARVRDVEQGSPAWAAGIQRGDRIVRINDVKDPVFDDIVRQVALGNRGPVRVDVERNGKRQTFNVEPEYNQLYGARTIGVLPPFEPVVTGLSRVGGPDGPSPAKDAGVNLGDRILAVNGVATPTASDINRQLLDYPDSEVSVLLERKGKQLTVRVHTHPTEDYMLGISGVGLTVKELQPGGLAQQAGLRVGDRITAVGGKPARSFQDATELMGRAHGPVTLSVARGGSQVSVVAQAPDAVAAEDFLAGVLFDSSPTLTWVMEGGPAWQAGMRPGDVVVSAGGREMKEWKDVMAAGQSAGRQPREMQWRRGEQTFSASLTPALEPTGEGGLIGVETDWPVMEVRKYGPASAVVRGLSDFKQTLMDTVVYLQRIATAQVSAKNLGGMVTIARISYHATEFGLGMLLWMTAVLSASIAFLNVLPIPVLDGGHLLFLAIEKLRGRRVSEKAMSIAQTVGFVLLILLVVYVTRNDIMHLIGPG